LNKFTYTYANSTQKFPGGKSVNVSRMLFNLGVPSVITGFIGGYPGGFVKKWFEDHQLDHKLIEIDEDSSTNVKLKTPNEQIVIKGKKPNISEEKLEELMFYLSRIREGDIVVLGGSIPENATPDIYIRIAEICQANRAESVIDVLPAQLIDLLKYKPLLIKPNISDLAKMFGIDEIEKEEDIIKYAKKCQELGARNVIVTLSEKGSYLFSEDGEVFR
ncbi:1-phosphofructokinase family hexose kinase, partial [Rhodovulum adriaticum]|uniref:1-phosphofructokinase family hexose kinase n=1 Tax=Rhodovulum adriaticum TaxID=35804 RepID=UPI0019072198